MGNHIVELCCCFFFFFLFYVEGATINVKDHGVIGDGKTDDSKGFLKAWSAACASAGTVKLLVPKATYLIGPLTFQGPCKQASSFIFQHEGYLKATTDLNKYPSDVWLRFAKIDHMTLTGGGTFDGQGASAWPHNSCPKNSKCKVLPTSLIFLGMTNTIIKGINSVNSMFFHIGVVSCTNFHAESLHITAPDNSPNTDGIHITRSTHVKILSSNIGTGDDCISIGDTSVDVYISNIQCGPGHGISVGSLGRYTGEGNVKGLIVKDSTLTGTTNGVRIKTWMNAAAVTSVTNVTFSNVIMNNVYNPIIVDQKYCPYASCPQSTPSTIKITDLTFDGIRGSSMSPVAVKLICSKSHPCQNVKLNNIQLRPTSGTISSQCESVKPQYSGPQSPQPCK